MAMQRGDAILSVVKTAVYDATKGANMRLAVMQRRITARSDTAAAEVEIKGQDWVLLRALLFQTEGITSDSLAEELGITPASVPTQVKRLRAKLHDNRSQPLIKTAKLRTVDGFPTGYVLGLDSDDWVDAHEFRRLAKIFGSKLVDFDEVPAGAGEDVEAKRAALNLMVVNPGDGDSHVPGVARAYREFDDYRSQLALATAFGYVRRWIDHGRTSDATDAMLFLTNFVSAGPAQDEIWALVFRLGGSLTDWRSRLAELKGLLERSDDDPSPELLELLGRVEKRDPEVLLKPVGTPSGSESPVEVAERKAIRADEDNLTEVAVALGVSTRASLRLQNSRMAPSETIDQTISRLWFSGILGGKYVLQEATLGKLENLLDRLDSGDEAQDAVGTPVRLMIVDPESKQFSRLKRLGLVDSQAAKSIPVLQSLVAKHPSFAVRMYSSMPMFRIIIVDDSIVTVGPYIARPVDFLPNHGWDAPQLVLTPTARYPLAAAFVSYFKDLWDRSRDIRKLPRTWKP